MLVIPEGIEHCVCGHTILMHYLKVNSDEPGECIIIECKCSEYKPERKDSVER